MGSAKVTNHRYVGITSDLEKRLEAHDHGQSRHTSKYRPWTLVTYVAFTDDQRALEFERYMKAGSGHAFANSHLW
jgi:predicted GIY-YIG superfamily endonuclease